MISCSNTLELFNCINDPIFILDVFSNSSSPLTIWINKSAQCHFPSPNFPSLNLPSPLNFYQELIQKFLSMGIIDFHEERISINTDSSSSLQCMSTFSPIRISKNENLMSSTDSNEALFLLCHLKISQFEMEKLRALEVSIY